VAAGASSGCPPLLVPPVPNPISSLSVAHSDATGTPAKFYRGINSISQALEGLVRLVVLSGEAVELGVKAPWAWLAVCGNTGSLRTLLIASASCMCPSTPLWPNQIECWSSILGVALLKRISRPRISSSKFSSLLTNTRLWLNPSRSLRL